MNFSQSRSLVKVFLYLCGPLLTQAQNASKIIEAIEFRGALHTPQETLKALIATKPGDAYNEGTLGRDFTALWKTGGFSDIELKTELGAHGGIIARFVLTEREDQLQPTVIESIEFRGALHTPQETLKVLIATKPGDAYNEGALGRDFTALWKTGGFSDIRLSTETGPRGGVIVRFGLTERQ